MRAALLLLAAAACLAAGRPSLSSASVRNAVLGVPTGEDAEFAATLAAATFQVGVVECLCVPRAAPRCSFTPARTSG